MQRLLMAFLVALALLVTRTSHSARVDVLWWDGADQYGQGQNVPIHPFAGGDKLSLGSDTLGDGLGTWDLVITDYSRTWDVAGAAVGDKKQADLFISFSSEGVSAYVLSVRYDKLGKDMLDVVALREYNVWAGTDAPPEANWGLGTVDNCAPANNCSSGKVTSPNAFSGLGHAYLAQESALNKEGWVYRFTSLEVSEGPSTKNSTQVGTFRVGSILFELNHTTGTTSVEFGAFRQPGALDSINMNSGANAEVRQGDAAKVVGAVPAVGELEIRNECQVASAWLQSPGVQNGDGSWGDGAAKARTTAEVVLALRAFGEMRWSYYQGISWLENHAMATVEDHAYRILALAPHALPDDSLIATEFDISVDRQALKESLRSDPIEGLEPGWGVSAAYLSSPIETAVGVQAAAFARIDDLPTNPPGLNSSDGPHNNLAYYRTKGWPLQRVYAGQVAPEQPSPLATAAVLRAYAERAAQGLNVSNAEFAAEDLAGDGSSEPTWAYSQLSVTERAAAAVALAAWERYGGETFVRTQTATALLEDLLDNDQDASSGSWSGDAYTTALALHACALVDEMNLGTHRKVVNFPDFELRRALNAILGGKPGDEITYSQLQTVTVLDLSGYKVRDFTGLNQATNLTQVILPPNTGVNPVGAIAGTVLITPTDVTPVAPSGLVASDGAWTDRVSLTWDPASGAEFYNVYRSRDESEGGLIATRLKGTFFEDRSALPDVVYTYRISSAAFGTPTPVESVEKSEEDRGYRAMPGPAPFVSQQVSLRASALAVADDGVVYAGSEAGDLLVINRDGSVVDLVAQARPDPPNPGPLDDLGEIAALATYASGSATVLYVATRGAGTPDELLAVSDLASSVLVDEIAGPPGRDDPSAIAVGTGGNLYVAWYGSNEVAEYLDDVFANTIDGPTGCTVDGPNGLAIRGESTVYVASEFAECVFESAEGTPRQANLIIGAAGDGEHPLSAPTSVVVNDDYVFVSDSDSQWVFRIDTAGEIEELLHPGPEPVLSGRSSLAVDHRGNVYIAGESSHTIYQLRRSGVVQLLFWPPEILVPRLLGADSGGHLFVGDYFCIHRIPTATIGVAPGPLDLPNGPSTAAVTSTGEILFGGYADDLVLKVSPEASVSELLLNDEAYGLQLVKPSSVVIGDDGSVYFAGEESDNVIRIAPWGQPIQVASYEDFGLDSPQALAFVEGKLYVASGIEGAMVGQLIRIDPTGAATPELLATGLAKPTAMVAGPDPPFGVEAVLYIGFEGVEGVQSARVADYRVVQEVQEPGGDPVTVANLQSVIVADGEMGSFAGQANQSVVDLSKPAALGLRSSILYVAADEEDTLYGIERSSLVINTALGPEGDGVTPLDSPRGIAFDGVGHLYIAGRQDVFRVDLLTGKKERVFDLAGDGLHLGATITALSASSWPPTDSFVVGTWEGESNHAFATALHSVPEPGWQVALPVLIVALLLLGRVRFDTHFSVGSYRSDE